MSWRCFMAQTKEDRLKVGAVWDWGKHGWAVRLPGPSLFYQHRKAKDGTEWQTSGEPPNITVNPSINVEGVWHGWIQGGVISDDPGHRYDADGRLLRP